MSNRWFIDGFEGGNTGLWTSHTYETAAYIATVDDEDTGDLFAPTGDFTTPAVGSNTFYFDGTSSARLSLSLIKFSDNGQDGIRDFYIKFRIQPNDDTSSSVLLYFTNEAGSTIGSLRVVNNIMQWISGGVTKTSSVQLTEYEWNLVELFISLSDNGDTNGALALRLKGESHSMILQTEIITNDAATDPEATTLYFMSQSGKAYMIDDLSISQPPTGWDRDAQDADSDDDITDDMPGDGYIVGAYAGGAGTDTQWTGLYSQVNEAGDSDTVDATYMSETTVGHKQSFDTFGTIPTMETVYCVQVCARLQRLGNPDIDSVKLYVVSDGTTDESDNITLNLGSFHTQYHIWDLDVAAGTPEWTDDSIADLEVGVEAVNA